MGECAAADLLIVADDGLEVLVLVDEVAAFGEGVFDRGCVGVKGVLLGL